MENYLMTIDNAKSMLDKKILSCEELVRAVLNNSAILGCATGAYITTCRESAIEEAKRCDREGRDKPLSGIPIAIKDNISTKGIRTTAGSKMLEKYIPPFDATVVERLKENGAIIIGKTNMDEFGIGSGCENSAYKLTANPVNYAYVPGGSSGGSACAVKTSQAIAALGSDTGGSVRQPAAFCGLCGLKPTYSLVSRYGLIEYSSSLDSIGPITSSVKDSAIMLSAIAGYDKRDMTSARKERKDYTKCLTGNIRDIKIGVMKEFFENCDEDVKNEVLKAIEDYRQLGARIDECSLKSMKYTLSSYYVISSCEAFSNLSRYDGIGYSKAAEGCNLIEEMYEKSRTEGLGSNVKAKIMFGALALSGRYYEGCYNKAIQARAMIKREFDALFEKFDILIAPVSSERVWKRGEKTTFNKELERIRCTAAVNLAHLPAISIPCGHDINGMPVGLQIIGKAFDEETVLNAAYAYETKGGSYGGI